jgi:hypothetical protein
MIDREKTITASFFKLGETFGTYNDNRTKMTQIATILFENLLEKIGSNNNFLYNATKVKPPLRQEDDGIFKYNLPTDFLSLIYSSEKSNIIGEYIFSEQEDLEITYCRTLPLLEIPNYMKEYITLSLALEIAQAVSAYENKIPLLQKSITSERIRISSMEGLIEVPTTREE